MIHPCQPLTTRWSATSARLDLENCSISRRFKRCLLVVPFGETSVLKDPPGPNVAETSRLHSLAFVLVWPNNLLKQSAICSAKWTLGSIEEYTEQFDFFTWSPVSSTTDKLILCK